MTSLVPRSPYSDEELRQLYPEHLQLKLVQVLLRHGERSPVSPRFQNAGLHPNWPYCNAARRLTGAIMGVNDWDEQRFRRRLETMDANDYPIVATGPNGEKDGICQPGELTDKGRETTLALGQRLRHLYIDQLGFMPSQIATSDAFYIRATPIPRALESVQQTFHGLYPPATRAADFPPPTVVTRAPADETLFPNDWHCARFKRLTKAFGQRAADRWNDSDDMAYLTRLLGRWMPPGSPRVQVDSHPRLSGIVDTTSATLAHGPQTRLPGAFYDQRARDIADRVVVEEWFAGYKESQEYRTLGIGALVGDVVARMVGVAESKAGGEECVKFGLSGAHDTTVAAVLASFGAFEDEKWPPYTSHVALELFRRKSGHPDRFRDGSATSVPATVGLRSTEGDVQSGKQPSWWSVLFGGATKTFGTTLWSKPDVIGRKHSQDLIGHERARLDDFYVRVRYNDRVMQVPGCKIPGKHLEGDTTFCTLEAFKTIADNFIPRNWKQACAENLDEPAFPNQPEPGGYE